MSGAGCLREPRGTGRGSTDLGPLIGAFSQGGAAVQARGHVGALPDEVDLRARLVGRRIVQRGNGCAPSAAHMAVRMAAPAPIDTSWTATYAILRQLELGPGEQGPLPDVGSYMSRVVEAIEGWGICSVERWSNEVDLRTRVTADVLEAGRMATIDGVYRIAETGRRWGEQARAALAKGHGIVYGSTIGERYRRGPADGVYAGDSRPEDVGHARLLVGCRPGALLEANPWGQAWDRWIDEGWLSESGEAWGFYAFGGVSPAVVR